MSKQTGKRQFREICRVSARYSFCYCYLCGKQIEPGELSIDHKVPKSRGGTNDPENLRPCCKPCNNRKGALTAEEYALWLSLERKRNGQER